MYKHDVRHPIYPYLYVLQYNMTRVYLSDKLSRLCTYISRASQLGDGERRKAIAYISFNIILYTYIDNNTIRLI